MTFKFKPAEPTARPMSIGLAGPGGSGKTYTALLLANALADGGKVAFIDTERGRGREYVQDFDYIYTEFEPPFTPERYIEAIEAAIAAGAKAIVVDSATHEWEGEGGVLETVQAKVSKDGEQHRMRAWAENKPRHRAMVYYAARGKVHTIFCFRAREKVKVHGGGRVEPMGWQPCTNEEAGYEFRLFAMLDPLKEGVPAVHEAHKSIKYLKPLWKPGQQITPEIAAKIAAWTNGAQKPRQASPAVDSSPGHSDTGNGATGSEGAAVRQQMGISHEPPSYEDQFKGLWQAINMAGTSKALKPLVPKVMDLGGQIPEEDYTAISNHLTSKSNEIREAEKAA